MKPGSFALLAPAILLAGVSVAAAQQPIPPPTAPLPPAPAALSVPNPLAGLRPGPSDLYRSPDGSDRFQHLSQFPAPPPVYGPVVCCPGPYFAGPYSYVAPYYDISMADTYKSVMVDTYLRQHRGAAARGGLVLEHVPDIAQVYVDGYYVGIAEEFAPDGRPIALEAGAHRIELRAPGYEMLTFSVMIERNGVVRYRGDMQQAAAKPAAAVAPSQPAAASAAKNFYVIPNCYAGDKPPTTLPKGCDAKKLQTRK